MVDSKVRELLNRVYALEEQMDSHSQWLSNIEQGRKTLMDAAPPKENGLIQVDLPAQSITIRQTRDPFVRPSVHYIAKCEKMLSPDGGLDLSSSKLDIGKPGEGFVVFCHGSKHWYWPDVEKQHLSAADVQKCCVYKKNEPHPTITIVEVRDFEVCVKVCRQTRSCIFPKIAHLFSACDRGIDIKMSLEDLVICVIFYVVWSICIVRV